MSSPDAVWVSAGLTCHPFRASAHPPLAEVPPPSALYSAYWVSSRFLRGGWELIVGSWRAPPALGKMRSFLEMKLDMLGKKAKGYPCTWLKYGRFTSIPSGLGWSPRALQWDDQRAHSHPAPWADDYTALRSPHFMHFGTQGLIKSIFSNMWKRTQVFYLFL